MFTTSSTDLKPIHPTNPTNATTIAYHLMLFGAANGSAATSATPANSIDSRVMLEPICELAGQTSTTPNPYTAAVIRTVIHSRGTRTHTRTENTSGPGPRTESHRLRPREREHPGRHRHHRSRHQPQRPRPQGRRFCRNSATATSPTNRPATGEDIVASAASGAAHRAFAQRL
ncbi:hypothetical protein SBADM41S_10091 [Streptomyces badius]